MNVSQIQVTPRRPVLFSSAERCFGDPVLLLCGHSFCKTRLERSWEEKESPGYPLCKQISLMEPPLYLALRNLIENSHLQTPLAPAEPEVIFSLHGEKLKLFFSMRGRGGQDSCPEGRREATESDDEEEEWGDDQRDIIIL
ncbi:unnamed protein product [Coregonus sp. 'balchen']|nr:unnamed protein product [Coregonus sp. 'balchen']